MRTFLSIMAIILILFFSFITLVKFNVIDLDNKKNNTNNNVDDKNKLPNKKIDCGNCKHFKLSSVILTNGDKSLNEKEYKLNEKILGLEIIELDSVSFTDSQIEDSVQVLFKGKIELTGMAKCESTIDSSNCNWRFIPDETSLSKLPYYANDTRDISFGFSTDSKEKFYSEEVGLTKTCNITIDNYLIFYYPIDVSNVADLVSYNCN